MTRSKQNLAAAEKLIKAILKENFSQKVDAKSLRSAAKKVIDAVPSSPTTTTKRAA